MKSYLPVVTLPNSRSRRAEQARAGVIILVLISFVLGLVAASFWHFRPPHDAGNEKQHQELSDATKAILKGLNTSVEIRFYSLLDPSSVSDSLQAFAGRVHQLLSEYHSEANGKIAVKNFKSTSADADAASADGIKPFNFDKGDACFLGLVIACNDQKEFFSQLSPQWEAALESDLTRAIVRVSNATTTTKPAVPDTSQPDRAAVEEVKRAIPNLASVSLEEGKRILREAAMNELSAAAGEMEKRVEEARARLVQAQSNSSEAGQQAAMKQFQQVQTEQTEKLKDIAARLQAQITALEQIKSN